METNDQYLIHYGVLGMKWGIRKDRRKKLGESKIQYKKDVTNIKSSGGSRKEKKSAIKEAKQRRQDRFNKIEADTIVKRNYGDREAAARKISNKRTVANVLGISGSAFMLGDRIINAALGLAATEVVKRSYSQYGNVEDIMAPLIGINVGTIGSALATAGIVGGIYKTFKKYNKNSREQEKIARTGRASSSKKKKVARV